MFKKNSANHSKIETIIGVETLVKGTINSNNSLRIDGKVEGEIFSEGEIVISESGRINGNIKGYNVTIAGYMNGNIDINGTLKLTQASTVEGEVIVGSIDIENGAKFKGLCTMKQDNIDDVKLIPHNSIENNEES